MGSMETMLTKMMGIDPAEIQKRIADGSQKAQALLDDFKAQLNRIEANQSALFYNQTKIKEALAKHFDDASVLEPLAISKALNNGDGNDNNGNDDRDNGDTET